MGSKRSSGQKLDDKWLGGREQLVLRTVSVCLEHRGPFLKGQLLLFSNKVASWENGNVMWQVMQPF